LIEKAKKFEDLKADFTKANNEKKKLDTEIN